MRILFLFGCLLFLPLSSVLAFGNDDAWQSGFGQGVCEAIITKGAGNKIYVATDCDSGLSGSINFTIGGRNIENEKILVLFDNSDPFDMNIGQGGIATGCRVCDENYKFMMGQFCAHSSVLIRTSSGEQTRFSLKGASKAIVGCKKKPND